VKPAIGLNADLRVVPSEKRERVELWRSYVRSVELAGGVPVVLPASDDPARVDEQLDVVDGLVLVGGTDYAPKLYGARRHPRTRLLHPVRQFYDIELARAAIRRRVPTLAICGGLQLVNIVCGGDLIQHLPDTVQNALSHDGDESRNMHEVRIEPDSHLARILGRDTLTVNSSHHQAVGRVGGGLRVAARSPDSVVEALEARADAFLVCVQWHPERLVDKRPEHLALFSALVQASADESVVA